jgi:hypothetical protein
LAAILLAACASLALAQDAKTSEVQAAARDWIALVDKNDYQASWRAAGTKFQANITAERWTRAVRRVRGPIGTVVQRTAARTTFTHHFPGAPEGDYALVLFRTSFAVKGDSQETVTLEHEPDGKWRVIGYTIR